MTQENRDAKETSENKGFVIIMYDEHGKIETIMTPREPREDKYLLLLDTLRKFGKEIVFTQYGISPEDTTKVYDAGIEGENYGKVQDKIHTLIGEIGKNNSPNPRINHTIEDLLKDSNLFQKRTPLEDLYADLNNAVRSEDYTKAAQLRDKINELKEKEK